MFNIGEWVECKNSFQTPELAVGARYEIANVRKNSCGVFQVWLSYKNKWYSAARFKSAEEPQELTENQTYSVVENNMSQDHSADSMVNSKSLFEMTNSVLSLNREHKIWCDTCEGGGEIDETLGGKSFSNRHAKCPDCDGKGFWLKSFETKPEESDKEKTEWTDKHYDFSYQLTQKDIENGFVKVDPYFVARIWQLGKKDDSGVLFHNLKNISRYGEKNSKEREIRALYAQIKRLAELEGVEL